MDRLAETARRNVRAREIYGWFLDRPDLKFRARDVSKEFKTLCNIQAMRLLIDHGLIIAIACSGLSYYKLNRVAPIDTCLDDIKKIDPTITRYFVAPSVACEYAKSDDLQKYAIG